MSPYGKIDCHSHYLPAQYREALIANGHAHPDGMPGVPPWSEESHLEMMQAINVTKSIISVSTPGTHLKAGDHALARKVTRHVNDVAADLKKRRPDQFGFFASLPLADVEGCLEEVPYALDQLDADGFVVLTNSHGSYLGHKDFDPIFDELNRRHAIVFIHPTTPCMPTTGQPATPLPDFPRPMFEFLFDTARAVINLFLSGTVSRCPNITFLIPHVGGALPPLINRFSTVGSLLSLPGIDPHVGPAWVKERLNSQFYFDTAGWVFPEQIHGLLRYITVDRMLYGSDFPYTPLKAVVSLSQEHDQHLPETFPDPADREKLCHQNAAALLRRR